MRYHPVVMFLIVFLIVLFFPYILAALALLAILWCVAFLGAVVLRFVGVGR